MENNCIIRVENLSHSYNGGKQWAVKDLNFQISDHGIVGLVGSNGAGKSTFMNILCGTLDQTKGSIFINGMDLKKDPCKAKKFLGFLPQKAPLYFDLTVDEYLTHAAKLRLMSDKEIKEAVDKAKLKCGIMHYSHRLIRNLSGGYQQRVGIAQAIVHDPKFVVLDEPTNGLDPNQIIEVRNLIKKIGQEKTVFISTHILSEVEVLCDHITMIESGEQVFSGTIDQFNSQIDTDAVIATFKNPPSAEEFKKVNGILSAELLNNEGQYRLRFDGDEDITERIVEESIKSEWRLSRIDIEKVPLDRVFAELSHKTFIN
jgi:ABC-2 type transport system ATP-binding protein